MTALCRQLAIDGGEPVRSRMLPYGRQTVTENDIASVVEALRSDWLTTGPRVAEFEREFAAAVGAAHAVAVSSGTAALHATTRVLDIGPGDEVIVPAITFVATANAVVYEGGTPVFADVDPATLLLDPAGVEECVTDRTRAIVAVDYAGQPCDYDALSEIAERHGLALVSDACHSLGGAHKGRPVGTLADMSVFSLHPVKPITTGEGGVITTDDEAMAARMRRFRNHGINSDHRSREATGTWAYDQEELGFNYRITDIQCALGISQLSGLTARTDRMQEIAASYREAFATVEGVEPLALLPDVRHAYHLFVIRLDAATLGVDRGRVFEALRAEGIGVNVHYRPVYLNSFYEARFGARPGLCPAAEAAYAEILSLPIFTTMTDSDVADVIDAVDKVTRSYREGRD